MKKEMYFAVAIGESDWVIGWADSLDSIRGMVKDFYDKGICPEIDFPKYMIRKVNGINSAEFEKMTDLNDWDNSDCRATLLGMSTRTKFKEVVQVGR